jgi:Flp pilus assembly pilin Flp
MVENVKPSASTVFSRLWRSLLGDDLGAQLAEYGLLAVLIGVFVMVSVAFFGDSLLAMFQDILDALPF